ncbi:MAG TPA: DUF6785 family protein, partial [Armatimonadota bacterium]|nr:DUF6785 family protein [Armatimonadota bacterium]
TVWALIMVVAGIPSSGLMRYLVPHIVAPHYYADASNGWGPVIVDHLPRRLFVSDPAAVKAFFEGLQGAQRIPWSKWLGPLGWWAIFVACLFTTFFCLASLLRRQWVENERFSFPLVRLPVLMAESPEPGYRLNRLLHSPMLWIAVALTTFVHTVKGTHLLFPSVPDIPMTWSSSTFITTPPWLAINDTQFAIFPLVIGFTYLLPSEVSFSLWFFYLIFKLQVLLGYIYSWHMPDTGTGWLMGPSYTAYQEAGGMVALAAWVVWTMREHLGLIWRRAVHNDPAVPDDREPLAYRTALFGFLGAELGTYVWLTFVARIQPSMACAVLLGALVVFVVLSWLVAQAGLLFAQHTFSPAQLLTATVGSGPFNATSLAMSSITEHVGWQDAREFMLPPLLNSFKAAQETNLNARSLTRWLAVSVVLAVVISAWASIWLPYTHGGATALKNPWTYVSAPELSFSWSASVLSHPNPPSPWVLLNGIGGALITVGLFACRTLIPSFPLHPAGFLIAASYPMYMLWFSIFLGWAAKGPIMRYGGMSGYRVMLPFFLGLIMGDTANAVIWEIVGLVTKTGYSLLPG